MRDLTAVQVGVAPSVLTPGIDAVPDEPLADRTLRPMTLLDALTTEHDSDAHFATYGLGTSAQAPPYRINLPCVPELTAKGLPPVTRLVVIDLDTPGHTHWCDLPKDFLASARHLLTGLDRRSLASETRLGSCWAAAFATRAGVRLIYVLDQDVPAEAGQDTSARVVQDLNDALAEIPDASLILVADVAAGGWNRLFRLPCVLRDGLRTSESSYFKDFGGVILREGCRLTPEIISTLPLVEARPHGRVSVAVGALSLAMPDPEEAASLIHEPLGPGEESFYELAKRKIPRGPLHASIFSETVVPLAVEGGRNVAIHSAVGVVLNATLYHAMNRPNWSACPVGPEHYFGLLYRTVHDFDPADDEDFHETLWAAICRYYPRDYAKHDETLALADALAAMAAGPRRDDLVARAAQAARAASEAPAQPPGPQPLPSPIEAPAVAWDDVPDPSLSEIDLDLDPPVNRFDSARAAGTPFVDQSQAPPPPPPPPPPPAAQDPPSPEAIRQRQLEVMTSIMTGMRQWVTLPPDGPELSDFVCRKMIIKHGRYYYVMSPNGRYETGPVDKDGLIHRIDQLGMAPVLPTMVPTPNGKSFMVQTIASLTKGRTTEVHHVRRKPQCDGGYLEDCDTKAPYLVLESFSRNPRLQPTFNRDVDQWLYELFGPEDYDWACKWIGLALAFEHGPTCGISIVGAPGCGKGLLVRGLVECLKHPAVALGRDLVDNFNAGIGRSPFLSLNEGIPTQRRHRNVADAIREAITGDPVYVNEKNLPAVEVRNPLRIIFTANNEDVILEMCRGKDLLPDDRNALAVRIAHFDVGNRAAEWLKAKGGQQFTRGWIEGQGGQKSNFVVARHFLYLHGIHSYGLAGRPPAQRLLLEGNLDGTLMQAMRAQGGSTPTVIETLVTALNKKTTDFTGETGLRLENGRLFVTISFIIREYRTLKLSASADERLTPRKVGNVLKGLLVGSVTRFPNDFREWWEIDVAMIKEEIKRWGWACGVLGV